MKDPKDLTRINPEGSTLRRHQKAMLELLTYIDQVCAQHHIPYYLSGGTLLGAVRHQGFIPWDDDLDVVLMKKDFRRLIRLLRTTCDPRYVLQCRATDPYYVSPYAKLRMRNTCIKERHDRDLHYRYRGVYIDLFYLEPALPLFHRIANQMQNQLVRVTQMKPDGKIKPFLTALVHGLCYRIVFPAFGTLSFLCRSSRISYPLGSFFATQFKRKWYASTRKIRFEEHRFAAPGDADSVLKAQYGNYHRLPDPDEIENHVVSVEF